MNLGLRLGPFRLGTNSRGQVYGGVSAGPVSVSGRLGGGSRQQVAAVVHPETLDEMLQKALDEGWHVVGRSQWTVRVERGWRAAVIAQVQGGTQVRRDVSKPVALLTIAAVSVVMVVSIALAMA